MSGAGPYDWAGVTGAGVDLLVIGGSGFIGGRLVQAAAEAGQQVAYTYASRPVSLPGRAYELRIEQAGAVEACLEQTRPAVVVYGALPSLHAPEAAHRAISVEGVRRVCTALSKWGTLPRLVYLSTNAVFGGPGPHREGDRPDPETRRDAYRTYALTKAAGERLALDGWPNTLVVRTCMVNGRDAQGELNPRLAAVVEHLQAGQALPRFCDRFFTPTEVGNLVEALLETIGPAFTYRGVLHLAGRQRVSDYEYARSLARRLWIDEALVQEDYLAHSPALARSPRDTGLHTRFTQNLLRTPLLDVEGQLASIFPSPPSPVPPSPRS